MVLYNFKKIQVVPDGKDFLDIVLSKTQRKTPTVVHPQYSIGRIRKFYMRKVKYTQASFHEKISQILEDFPRLDDIHPFYADLINILYDRDHYKLALGQLNTARALCDNISKDYVRLLKYGDTLYRCKQLKRAALGRMCTLMKKLGPSLAYLEQVRQHLSRLPSIDPSTRTLILTGFPNVGKSSFMNKVTRANVEVHDYPFTTKSIFVGHTDFKYLRWQVLDTPGILDHGLEDRNAIEMQAITALAHLRAAIMYFVDVSEKCGYSIEQQISLFHTISPLFTGKPVILVFNKTDLKRIEDLAPEQRALFDSLPSSVVRVHMSTATEEGIDSVKEAACELLLAQRVDAKLKSTKGTDVLQRIHVAMPKPRDSKVRDAFIPDSVLQAAATTKMQQSRDSGSDADDSDNDGVQERQVSQRKLMKHIEQEMGGPGEFHLDMKAGYMLKNPDWKYDVQPEILDGHNIADFIDSDIMARLDDLDKEEDERIAALEAAGGEGSDNDTSDLSSDTMSVLKKIRRKKKITQNKSHLQEGMNKSRLPRSGRPASTALARELEAGLAESGFDPESIEAAKRSSTQKPRGRSLTRAASRERERSMDLEGPAAHRRSMSRARSGSRPPGKSVSPERQAYMDKGETKMRKMRKQRNLSAKKGEADRHIPDLKPKHLYSGKRTMGTHDRR